MTRGAGCVVIGSGPSLKGIDVRALADVDTVAFNRSYIAWSVWGFAPTFYCCLDPDTFVHNANAIAALIPRHERTRFFLNSRALRHGIAPEPRVSVLNVGDGADRVTGLPTIRDYGNVGASSLQILTELGYRRLVLVGVDGRYQPAPYDGPERDRNYFQAGYNQGLWTKPLPAEDTIREEWRQAAEDCGGARVEILNASPGSSLTCFPLAAFEEALDWVRHEPAGI